MKNEQKEFKNKLLISQIKMLLPNFNKTFYLNIIVNEDKTFKTKKLEFKKSNIIEINQVFELEGISNIDVISFQLCEKTNIFSNTLFKGEIIKKNKIKDEETNQLICFLSNNNQENCAVIYYNYELNPDLLDTFDENLKLLEKENQVNNEGKTSLNYLKELARGENTENFSKFVHNQEYVRSIESTINEFVYWRNPWKTVSILFLITCAIIYWKIVFITSPIVFIYFHLYNREKMDKFSHKNTKSDNLANMSTITKTIDIINDKIDSYENFLDAMQHSDKKIYEEIYVNLIKLVFWNILAIYFNVINFKVSFIFTLWFFILFQNVSFRAFIIFLINFCNKKFFSKFEHLPRIYLIYSYSESVYYNIIPFAELFRKIYKFQKESLIYSNKNKQSNSLKEVLEKINDKTILVSNNEIDKYDIKDSTVINSNSSSQEFLKFEIYENERWWVFVGWAKNLVLNEIPLWSDLSGKTYKDKNSVFLPNNEEYQWSGDWKVEYSDISDENGWEYGSDFKRNFGIKSNGKYVRRRKWVRYAKKINK